MPALAGRSLAAVDPGRAFRLRPRSMQVHEPLRLLRDPERPWERPDALSRRDRRSGARV